MVEGLQFLPHEAWLKNMCMFRLRYDYYIFKYMKSYPAEERSICSIWCQKAVLGAAGKPFENRHVRTNSKVEWDVLTGNEFASLKFLK